MREIHLTPEKIITTISNAKTGEVYKDEEALKAAISLQKMSDEM